MWFDNNEPFEIYQDHEHIKRIKDIIKSQCDIVCRGELSTEYVSFCLKEFNYGYVILSKMGSIGQQQKTLSSKYLLKGFVLFRYEESGSMVIGKILCARDGYNGTGKRLLECVYDFILKKKVYTWFIHSLPDERLLKYYESAGFTRGKMIYRNGKNKVCEMKREFTYEEKETCNNEDFCLFKSEIESENLDESEDD